MAKLLPAVVRTFKDARGFVDRSGVELRPKARAPRGLTGADVPLIAVVHNERKLLPSFLTHYRGLGVTRFLCVDDQSTDGSAELLAAQPDVDLFVSNVRYAAAHRGRRWRQLLADRYGRGRWYVMVDVDEFLVAPGLEGMGLKTYAAALAELGIWHMPAIMLDMYPAGRIAAAKFVGECGQMPWSVASCFDASGYRMEVDHRSWKITGGARQRVFGDAFMLNKYPLIYWDGRTNLYRSIHSPAPYWRNYAPIAGALLHFKFFSHSEAQFRTLIANGQHARGAYYYAKMLSRFGDHGAMSLESEVSATYCGTADLARRGLIAQLPVFAHAPAATTVAALGGRQ